jgi:hypothetical protein
VRWCADADISAVLYLRPTEDIPMTANWLRKDAAVSFETHVIDTDDADRSTESWDRVNEVLPQILTFMIEKLKVSYEPDVRILIAFYTVISNVMLCYINTVASAYTVPTNWFGNVSCADDVGGGLQHSDLRRDLRQPVSGHTRGGAARALSGMTRFSNAARWVFALALCF